MTRRIENLAIAICSIAFFFATASGQNRAVVKVLHESKVLSDRLNLGDIAQISGIDTDRLKNISLGYSPAVGMTRELNRGQIAVAIKAAGFADGSLTLETPPRILVRRVGQTVSTDLIRQNIEQAVATRLATENVLVQKVSIDLPPNSETPAGNVEVRTQIGGVQNLFGRFLLPVELRVDGRTVRSFAANVEVEAFADVFVAANDILPGTRIDDGNLRLENRRVERPLNSYLRNASSLRGLKALRFIAAGEPMTADRFAADVVVRAGDTVRVEAVSGKLKININGEARGQGRIGDRIAVRNVQSGAMLQAIVVDDGLVRVAF